MTTTPRLATSMTMAPTREALRYIVRSSAVGATFVAPPVSTASAAARASRVRLRRFQSMTPMATAPPTMYELNATWGKVTSCTLLSSTAPKSTSSARWVSGLKR